MTAGVYFAQALDIARETGSRHDQGRMLGWLGVVAQAQGKYGQALAHFTQARQIALDLHDRRGEGVALHQLGLISVCIGKYVQALEFYRHALSINREIGDRRAEVMVLADLGVLYRCLHEQQAALEHHRQTLHLAQELGLQAAEGVAWMRLGQDWEDMGQLANAQEAYQHALAVRCDLGERRWMREAVSGLARVALALGDLGRAACMAQDMLAYLEESCQNCACDIIRNYLTCYRVLQANRDARASSILTTAYRLLEEQARTIGDDELQKMFYENVPFHRELVLEYKKQAQLFS